MLAADRFSFSTRDKILLCQAWPSQWNDHNLYFGTHKPQDILQTVCQTNPDLGTIFIHVPLFTLCISSFHLL